MPDHRRRGGHRRRIAGDARFSIDGVSLVTAALPSGWRDRLVKVQNDNTAAIGGQPRFTGWCLERHDLCVAKLVALREEDTNFVAALIDAGLVDPQVTAERLVSSIRHGAVVERAKAGLASSL